MMTKNNFQKKLIRERMRRTGESYLVAARELAKLPLPSWPSLDAVLGGGFNHSGFYIVGGRPGAGKSTFGMNLALTLSKPNRKVAYISMEQSAIELARTLFQVDSGTPYSVETPDVESASYKHVAKNIKIYAPHKSSVDDIRNFIEEDGAIKAVVIDYLQLLSSNDHISALHIADALKNLAYEKNIPIIGLLQLNRNSSKESDSILRYSTEYAIAADVALTLAKESHEEDATLNISVVKNRYGALGKTQLAWTSNRQLLEL